LPSFFSNTIERAPIGVVEQPDRVLQMQHAADAFVQSRERDLALLDEVGQPQIEQVRLHGHVHTRHERLLRCVATVLGIAMRDQFLVRSVVADDHPAEPPFAA
jgi:hypothetical protein